MRERQRTAGEVVLTAVRALIQEFDASERALMRGDPEGAHRHRTAVRRLRSVLAAYGGVFDDAVVTRVRAQLKDWGAALGAVRDEEEGVAALARLIDDLDDPDRAEHLRRVVLAPAAARADAATRRLRDRHDGPRQVHARADLRRFAEQPPLSARASRRPKSLRRQVEKEARRVRRAAARSDRDIASEHEFRKAARRLRHAVEAVTADPPGLFGDRVARVGRRAKDVQKQAGARRDAANVERMLRRTLASGEHTGEDARALRQLAGSAARSADGASGHLAHARRRLLRAVDRLSR